MAPRKTKNGMSQGPRPAAEHFRTAALDSSHVLILLIKEVQLASNSSKRYRGVSACHPVIVESLIARQIWRVTYALGLPHTNAWNWSLSTWCISNAVAQASFKYSSRTAYAAGQNITRPWLLQVAAGDLKPPWSCFRRLQ